MDAKKGVETGFRGRWEAEGKDSLQRGTSLPFGIITVRRLSDELDEFHSEEKPAVVLLVRSTSAHS